jgi:hypothetical protein
MKECFLQLHFSPALTCFYYHKFVNLGRFRVNLSKSGLGYSVGDLGFRIETTAHGGKNLAPASPEAELAIANRMTTILSFSLLLPIGIAATKLLTTLINQKHR